MISFEPETANLELLDEGPSPYRARGADWQIRAQPSAPSAARPCCASCRAPGRTRCIPLTPGRSTRSARSPCRSRRWPTSSRRLEPLGERVDRQGEHRGRGVRDRARNARPRPGRPSASSSSRCTTGLRAPRAELAAHLEPVGFRAIPTEMAAVLRLRREEAPRSDHVPLPREPPLDRRSGARAERAGVELVAQHTAQARARMPPRPPARRAGSSRRRRARSQSRSPACA